MARQFGTTPDASLLRLTLRVSPVTGAAFGCGIDGRHRAPGEGQPSVGIAGMNEEFEGGRVTAADGAM
mgnify:CR=1 FL=1